MASPLLENLSLLCGVVEFTMDNCGDDNRRMKAQITLTISPALPADSFV